MRKSVKIIITIVVVLGFMAFLSIHFMKNFGNKEINEEDLKYNKEAIEVMKSENIFDIVKLRDYSKTLEVMLLEGEFKGQYLEEYYKIDYLDGDDFASNVSSLLDKKYNSEEINYINKNFKDYLDLLLNMDYIDILEFRDLSNFDEAKTERYLKYINDKHTEVKNAVTYVNIGLDMDGYSEYESYDATVVENDLTILVNKYHKLPIDYEPKDLVSLSYNENYKLRSEAADAYEKLSSAALLDNVIFYPFSAYRSSKTQEVLYNNYKARDGEKKADTYSARPGFSEHQLGLAIDIRSNTEAANLTSNDYKWMLDNSYKYGFIVRYPKGKEHITQFMEEPWHLRYLGVELATKVHESNLTYDEYYDLYMVKR